jgi:hypothetical protein
LLYRDFRSGGYGGFLALLNKGRVSDFQRVSVCRDPAEATKVVIAATAVALEVAVEPALGWSSRTPKFTIDRRRILNAAEFRLSFCERRIGVAEIFLAQSREFDISTDIPLSAILER